MAYIPNPEFAYDIVRTEQHAQGVWANLTDHQAANIGKVLRADRAGQLTKHDIVVRLHEIAHETR